MLLICLLRRAGLMAPAPLEFTNVLGALSTVEVLAKIESSVTGGQRPRAFINASRINETRGRRKILVWFPTNVETSGLLPGATLVIRGHLRQARQPRNPGDFDERRYLEDQGVSGVLHADWFRALKPANFRAGLVHGLAKSLRLSIKGMLDRTYPPQTSSVLSGILLGDKSALDPRFTEALKIAGAFHLIVPSGTNVAFVLVFFLWLVQCLRLPGFFHVLVPLSMAAFYGLMVGCDPPYLRAYLCALLAAISKLWDAEYDLFQALTLSALVLLIWDPRILFHQGFQMSYLVVWAILLAQPHKIAPSHWPRLIRLTLGLAASSAVAQAALLPVLAQMGGKFSLIGIVSNVALVPLCGLIMGAGYSLCLISLLPLPLIIKPAAFATGFLAELFRKICLACVDMPYAALDLWPMPTLMIMGYYLSLAAFFIPGRSIASLVLIASGLGMIAPAWFISRTKAHDLRVIALSVPGSGACLARLPNGKSWLIYGSGGPQTVLNALRLNGIRSLDKIVFLEQARARQRYRRRILDKVPSRDIMYWSAKSPFKLCRGAVCFRFDPQGPRVFKGTAEYAALPGALRRNALEIITDGEAIRFGRAF